MLDKITTTRLRHWLLIAIALQLIDLASTLYGLYGVSGVSERNPFAPNLLAMLALKLSAPTVALLIIAWGDRYAWGWLRLAFRLAPILIAGAAVANNIAVLAIH